MATRLVDPAFKSIVCQPEAKLIPFAVLSSFVSLAAQNLTASTAVASATLAKLIFSTSLLATAVSTTAIFTDRFNSTLFALIVVSTSIGSL
jgi:hypothetical protein